LAERRRDHLVELYDSGRWKHYYSEGELLYHMREAIQQTERWAQIAPRPEDEVFAEQARSQAIHRTAA
jgi:uncharacterized repeat protein (TIGR03809 family)